MTFLEPRHLGKGGKGAIAPSGAGRRRLHVEEAELVGLRKDLVKRRACHQAAPSRNRFAFWAFSQASASAMRFSRGSGQ